MIGPFGRRAGRVATVLAVASFCALGALSAAEDKAVFNLTIRGVTTPYDTAAVFVMPRERIPIQARGHAGATYAVRAKDGVLSPTGPNRWTWQAPAAAGIYKLEIVDTAPKTEKRPAPNGGDQDSVTVNAFVMVPASQIRNGRLNGYRIGEYPPGTFRGNPIYRAPRGFVEVTRDTADAKVSPHFEIGQFLCKQNDPFPKYVVLDERLPIKLEALIDRLNALGRDIEGLHVMSGYRTPFYNKSIGNVEFSVHQFGGAADVFVDDDRNGTMDDLNGDKRVDRRDAMKLYDIADRLSREKGSLLEGGLGHYPATRAHGPFVHVDVRGNAARWAD